MNDILPQDTPLWRYLEDTVRELMASHGFREIRTPVLEQTELFKRSIGEVTDIVEKEMYSFDDRNGESLTLRPEGTASCVRAAEEHGLLFNQQQRLWYAGPMFRYERPQKGRYRQFHQFGAEVFGWDGPDVDAELILLTAMLWQRLGIADALSLELNTLGTAAARGRYRADLVAYLSQHEAELDADSRRRLHSNPLRILDSKEVQTQALLDAAPNFADYMDAESRAHFAELCAYLDAAGLAYVLNPRLVRGLDYYSKTVFEWTTRELGAQGTVCGGGRYDGLVEQLGGKPTAAVGFAMGIERLVLMLQTLQRFPAGLDKVADIYIAALGEGAQSQALVLAHWLRTELPGVRVVTNCGGGSFKNQIKKADKSGADLALILGEEEVASGQVSIKPLRGEGEQRSLARAELLPALRVLLRRG